VDSNQILQLASSGDAVALRATLRDKAIRSLYYFDKVVMGYKDMVDHFHLPFCDHIQNTWRQQRRGYLMPRFHFKSTVGKGYCPWRLITLTEEEKNRYGAERDSAYASGQQELFEELEQVLHLHDPNTRIALIGESDSIAEKNLRDIKGKIEKSQLLRWLFPELIPDPGMKWAEDAIELPRTKSFDEYSIHTFGISSRKTGLHFDLLLYDDFIGEVASQSPAEMEKAWSSFQKAPGLSNDPFTVEELILGTRWKHGTADVYGRIMKFMPEEDTYVDEDGATRNTGFTWYIQSCWDEDGNPIFPERVNRQILEGHRKRMGQYNFACQFENNPTAIEGADFKPEWIKTYTISEDRQTILPDDGTPPIRLSKLLRMAFYDPSSGGRSATAENAIAGAGMAADRRMFALKMWSKNTSFGEALEKYHAINDSYIFYTTFYEDVGAQKSLEDIQRERRAQTECRYCKEHGKPGVHHKPLVLIPVKPPGGKGKATKEERIRTFAQPVMEEGRFYIHRGMLKLKKQILDFPHGDLVDEFDAVAYLCWKLRPPISDEQYEEEKDRQEKAAVPHQPRTHTEVNYGGYA
jgi:hypothetical protein